jgi:transcriptional regulator with GAF, ATPase, and Fis domain
VAPSDELKWRSRNVGSQCNSVLPSTVVVWKPNSKSNTGKQCPQSAPAEEILDAYPEIEKEDISQALRYAAWLSSEKAKSLPINGGCP